MAKKKEYVSKYAPKWYTFPRETTTYREFASQKEAEDLKEKLVKKGKFSSMSVQPGNIYQVCYWEKFETPEEFDADQEYIIAHKPKRKEMISPLQQMTNEEADAKLKEKITKEKKPRKTTTKKKK